jgi:hypothetical protein
MQYEPITGFFHNAAGRQMGQMTSHRLVVISMRVLHIIGTLRPYYSLHFHHHHRHRYHHHQKRFT